MENPENWLNCLLPLIFSYISSCSSQQTIFVKRCLSEELHWQMWHLWLIYPSSIRRRLAGASSRSIYPNSQMSSSPAATCQNNLTLVTNLFWHTRGWILTWPWQHTITVVPLWKTNRKWSWTHRAYSVSSGCSVTLIVQLSPTHASISYVLKLIELFQSYV